MYDKLFVHRMGLYLLRVAVFPPTPTNQESARGVEVSTTPCGAVLPTGTTAFVYGFGVVDVWKYLDPAVRPYPPELALTPRSRANLQWTSGVGVFTPLEAFQPCAPKARPHCVEGIDLWIMFLLGDETVSLSLFPGCLLMPHAFSMARIIPLPY